MNTVGSRVVGCTIVVLVTIGPWIIIAHVHGWRYSIVLLRARLRLVLTLRLVVLRRRDAPGARGRLSLRVLVAKHVATTKTTLLVLIIESPLVVIITVISTTESAKMGLSRKLPLLAKLLAKGTVWTILGLPCRWSRCVEVRWIDRSVVRVLRGLRGMMGLWTSLVVHKRGQPILLLLCLGLSVRGELMELLMNLGRLGVVGKRGWLRE